MKSRARTFNRTKLTDIHRNNMNSLYIIGLMMFVTGVLNAQSSFELRFPPDGLQSATNIVEDEDGILFSTAFCKPAGSNYFSKLIRIATNGDTSSVKYSIPSFNFCYQSMIITGTGDLLVFGSRYPDDGNPDTAYLTITSFTNTLQQNWSIEKALPFEYSKSTIVKVCSSGDGNLLIAGNVYSRNPLSGSRNDIFTGTFNTNDNILTFNILSEPRNQYLYDVYTEPDSLQIKLAVEGFSLHSLSQILTLDENFQILRVKDLNEILAGPLSVNRVSPDKILMTSVYHKPLGTSMDTRFNLVQLNSEMNIINNQYWDMPDTYDAPAWNGGIEITENSEYVIGGTYNTCFTSSRSWWVLAKMDTVFNMIWQRYYGGDAWYSLHKMLMTKDHGYIMAGNYCDTLNPAQQGIYILKVNADGLMNSVPERMEKNEQVSVYPNPANNILFLKSTSAYALDFELRDLTGRPVLCEKAVRGNGKYNIAGFHAGIYIYKVKSNKQLIGCGKIIIQ